jgi:pyridoxal phosphate enzyme (YggS family)
MNDISQNLKTLHSDMAAHAIDQNPQLVAVSKRQPPEKIQDALDAGHRLFGENRVQEAIEHWGNTESGHRSQYSDLKLHLIGPLQTNKAPEAVALFDVIETLDREKLARALSKEMTKQERHLPCFIQVNTGEEDQKSGISPQDIHAFYKFCAQDCGLNVTGLMCIPPVEDAPAMHFGLLSTLARELNLPHLSMGMSGDYKIALELGATHIRVGSAIFGERAA